MLDIVFLIPGEPNWNTDKQYEILKLNYPNAHLARGKDMVECHYNACDEANTSFFFVIDAGAAVWHDFDFDYEPDKIDKNWVLRFAHYGSDKHHIRLVHQSMFKTPIEELDEKVDFIYNFGSIGTKDLQILASCDTAAVPDIVFIDLSESFADAHYKNLVDRFGDRVKRSSGVKGLWQAHAKAARQSSTEIFYVVDSDVLVHGSFKFDYVPDEWDEKYVHVWNSWNEMVQLSYGNAGIKLLSKKFFQQKPGDYVDMTTMIASKIAAGVKYHDEVVADNHFFDDPYLAWRGAFRESAKLRAGVIDGSIQTENDERLNAWKSFSSNHPNASYVRRGVADGIEHIKNGGALSLINDYDWLRAQYGIVKRNESEDMQIDASFVYNVVGLLYDKDYFGVRNDEVRDALSKGQLLSKLWLANALNSVLHEQDISVGCLQKVLIVGGWIGTLSNILFQQYPGAMEITSLDLNPVCEKAAAVVNAQYDHRFKAITGNMYDYKHYEDFTIVINTSCEHIPDLKEWLKKIPKGTCVILQSNDYNEIVDHINCVNSIDEFKEKTGLSTIFYQGERNFGVYTRYMLIGEV